MLCTVVGVLDTLKVATLLPLAVRLGGRLYVTGVGKPCLGNAGLYATLVRLEDKQSLQWHRVHDDAVETAVWLLQTQVAVSILLRPVNSSMRDSNALVSLSNR